MPSTLTEAHRLAQLRLGAQTVLQLKAVWGLLDVEDLDGTFEDWLAVVAPIIDNGRSASADLAGAYIEGQRLLAVGRRFPAVLAGELDRRALVTSMMVTGPVSIRSNAARMPLAAAADLALGRTAAAGMRHVLNAGRETITATVKADPRAAGYQRVTSGNACDYCSELEESGALFGEDAVEFDAHDGCACTGEPVYR